MLTVEEQTKLYEDIRPDYEVFARRLRELLTDLTSESKIPLHLIESRSKSIDSFREKISRPGKSYKNGIKEISDLCGCRVITYYQDDCARIAEILKNEFQILEEEMSHQPHNLNADQFGYISAHYVIKLSKSRLKLREWSKFSELRAEIQVRTVIQHAWSAVSHALQYKAESEVPSGLQRRLYRIAGLFELADEEFEGIRNQRALLREKASEQIASGDTSIPLSMASLEEFVKQWKGARRVISSARKAGFSIYKETNYERIKYIYDLCIDIGIKNIDQLENHLSNTSHTIFKKILLGYDYGDTWHASLEFLIYIIILSKSSGKITVSYLVERDWTEEIAEHVLNTIA